VELAKKVGFDGVDLNDVEELLHSHKEKVSTEHFLQLEKEHEEGEVKVEVVRMLMSKRLAEALRLVAEGLAILHIDDPNSGRSSKVSKNVLEVMQCYTEILKENKSLSNSTAFLL
jgi:hypothetical protein